jgi:hypothetical protein
MQKTSCIKPYGATNRKGEKTMYKVTLTYAYRELNFIFDDIQQASFFVKDVLNHYDRSLEAQEDKHEKLKVTIALVESEVEE